MCLVRYDHEFPLAGEGIGRVSSFFTMPARVPLAPNDAIESMKKKSCFEAVDTYWKYSLCAQDAQAEVKTLTKLPCRIPAISSAVYPCAASLS